MKKMMLFFVLLAFSYSCEDVIDVDLNEGAPRLVIDARILKEIDTTSALTIVTLSRTNAFFDTGIDFVNDAEVKIISSNEIVYALENNGDGIYTTNSITPMPGETYKLEVNYNNEIYSATESLFTVTPLEYVEQENDGGFSGDDIELKAYFNDPEDIENYYLFEGFSEKGDLQNVLDDEFFDGNEIFGFFLAEDLAAGDTVTFYLNGVSKQYYNYMFILLQQSSDQGAGPFETQPATVRGNIVNETNAENYPLGYFRISEISILNYTVQ
ncbi:DUF4249 family protein [Aequorivita echinoideorum]|uniref:DUF4249 family protein n=1 Tax=Aequorivita echinoideorum TaxID=1549647 RepID=A0ABS5S7F1_9FLAO|nr:DUF4249 family protein [Aequorivita echinoideorum]MBT0609141.1 DUF4249 family protein [Aequorivita echinoideorum]